LTRLATHWPWMSSLWTAAVAAVVFGSFDSSARLFVVLPFILLVPGLSLVQLLELTDDTVAQVTMALALSIALVVLVPLVMISVGQWSPHLALLVLMAITVTAVGLKVAGPAGFTRRRRGSLKVTDRRRLAEAEAQLAPSVTTNEATETCTIEWWRGYLKSVFYARVRQADGNEYVAARSPGFWWRHSVPPPSSDTAVAAYQALVEQLTAHGWQLQPDRHDFPWWARNFRRAA
jgi:hypothetical protein